MAVIKSGINTKSRAKGVRIDKEAAVMVPRKPGLKERLHAADGEETLVATACEAERESGTRRLRLSNLRLKRREGRRD